eukprot:CAMPEP_0184488710 /NCGR_PEP_ID=MMETSP0113_2-20130426/13098_1 /TAXON_ID=91329 /ORGANISM="Norrisiella sphaerica, Strain BC52" /LENGTH=154 /DNA_ID=CAMNT_0026871673 /DNA_START=177 /DNA_END=638 /DNA_ORIENTATION=+
MKDPTEFFFNNRNVSEPWRNPDIWKTFLFGVSGGNGDPYFDLNMYIDIIVGGTLRFLANPTLADQNFDLGDKTERENLKMKDITLYCRKLPPVLRRAFVARLEERLNKEGYSLTQSDIANFNPEHLALLFTPKNTEKVDTVHVEGKKHNRHETW